MKISIDGGAICGRNQFGNFVVTKNLVEAITLYDNLNEYYLYSFCERPFWLKTKKNIHYLKLLPRHFWMNFRVSTEEIFCQKDIFLALNQATPFFTLAKIIAFCHGLSFYFYPQFYSDSYWQLKKQLETMVKKSAYILVSSQKVRNELITIFPKIEKKIKVLSFGIPFDFCDKAKNKNQNREREKIFLFVGMDHPIKNIAFIKRAFSEFKKDYRLSDYKLYLVTKKITRDGLKQLYQKATALLTASYYESFNLPVLEALSLGCQVIGLESAIIPELTSYVNIAQNREDFVEKMRLIAMGQRKNIDEKSLKENFSWRSYFNKLRSLYGKI